MSSKKSFLPISKKTSIRDGSISSTSSVGKNTVKSYFSSFSIDNIKSVSDYQWIVKEKENGNKLEPVGNWKNLLLEYSHDEEEMKKKRDWMKCAELAEKVDGLRSKMNPSVERINQVQKAMREAKFAICYYTSNRQYLLIPHWEKVKDSCNYLLQDVLLEESQAKLGRKKLISDRVDSSEYLLYDFSLSMH